MGESEIEMEKEKKTRLIDDIVEDFRSTLEVVVGIEPRYHELKRQYSDLSGKYRELIQQRIRLTKERDLVKKELYAVEAKVTSQDYEIGDLLYERDALRARLERWKNKHDEKLLETVKENEVLVELLDGCIKREKHDTSNINTTGNKDIETVIVEPFLAVKIE